MLHLLATDVQSSHLARLEYSNLSTQALLEMLISNTKGHSAMQDANKNFLDIDDWTGVHRNEEHAVTTLIWSKYFDGGEMDLQWLPPDVKCFNVSDNGLCGHVDFTLLPPPLETLLLAENAFTGSVNISGKNKALTIATFNSNSFSGSLDLGALPSSLIILNLQFNKLSGTLDLAMMPETLECLYLSGNDFHGTADCSSLPRKMRYLYLNSNRFAGTLDFRDLPPKLEQLDVSSNEFEQERVVIGEIPGPLRILNLRSNAIREVVDTEGKPVRKRAVLRPTESC